MDFSFAFMLVYHTLRNKASEIFHKIRHNFLVVLTVLRFVKTDLKEKHLDQRFCFLITKKYYKQFQKRAFEDIINHNRKKL